MMKYEIVTASNTHDLTKAVNNKIENGWEPIGGINGGPNSISRSCVDFQQAMIKPSEVDIGKQSPSDFKS